MLGGARGRFRFRLDGIGATDPFYLDLGQYTTFKVGGTGPIDFTIYLERYDGTEWIVDDSHHVVIREKKAEVSAHIVTMWGKPGKFYEPITSDSASLYVNGTYKGVTPIDLELDPGTYTFEARKPGFTPYPVTHSLSAGGWHVTTYIAPEWWTDP